MSRQEDFDKAADEYSVGCDEQDDRIYAELHYERGCEYGYQYAKEKFLDILTHWCNRHGVHPTNRVDIINDIKQAMEE